MTQYEQENDLGGGGGEVDEQTHKDAWERSLDDRPIGSPEQEGPSEQPE